MKQSSAFAPLSPTTRDILEKVRDWDVIDREQLTALCACDGLSAEGVRTALGRLASSRFLSRDLRNAHHPKAQLGLARKRIVYYLAQEGRRYFGYETGQRERLTAKVKRFAYYPERLPHAVGVSWIHTLLAVGHQRRLWDLHWRQGAQTALTMPVAGKQKRHIPDAVATLTTFKPFTRFIEYEHRNKGQTTVNHALFYLEAFRQGRIDGRVVWVCKSEEKLRYLRSAICAAAPKAGSLFIFLSQDTRDLTKPEDLLVPMFPVVGSQRTPIVPGRKDQEAVT